MALPQEILEYGSSNSPLVNEPSGVTPVVLVDSLNITAARDEQLYQNLNGTTTRAKYTNPTLTFDFTTKISLESGLSTQHPGTLVPSLANFQSELHGFDPNEGILVFKDPSRELSEEQDYIGYNFQVLHLPFVNE